MKQDTHPEKQEITISCACGAEYKTVSVKKSMRVEICSKCHPFFTGKKKVLDSDGRVERFKRKYKGLLGDDEEETEDGAEEEENGETAEAEKDE